MPEQPVTVVLVYRAHAGKGEEGLAALSRLVATVVAEEPDCLGIRVHRDLSDPDRILLLEEWTSREAYLGPHFQTPHLKAFIEGAPSLFQGPPDISFWELRSEERRGVSPDPS